MKALAILMMALAVLLPSAYAVGYGTSSISLSSSAVRIAPGNSTTIGFNVNLSSGNTWGTTLVLANQNQLNSEGISIGISNDYADPPYSGTLNLKASSSAVNGTYPAVIAAEGDDPSTSNVTLYITVGKVAITTTVPANSAGSASSTVPATVPVTTTAVSVNYGHSPGGSPKAYSMGGYGLAVFIIIVLIIAAYLVYIMKAGSTKAIIVGVALILIGVAVWIYGDYNGGLMSYIWTGVAAILLGTLIWILGDYAAGAFSSKKK